MKISRAKRQINYVGDSRDQECLVMPCGWENTAYNRLVHWLAANVVLAEHNWCGHVAWGRARLVPSVSWCLRYRYVDLSNSVILSTMYKTNLVKLVMHAKIYGIVPVACCKSLVQLPSCPWEFYYTTRELNTRLSCLQSISALSIISIEHVLI